MYRTYLRTFDQKIIPGSKINTTSQAEAAQAFAELVGRTDLDGQKIAAALTFNSRQLAFHRFDRAAGDVNCWRDRLDEIEWPEGQSGRARGGARDGAGRKTQTGDGGPLRRCTATLDETSIAILTAYGDGELSEGIRRAARALPERRLP